MNSILFALGALTMVIEFAIPRLIAPAYGYTMLGWTAIISVVLVAMTVGYFWGGKLTEQGKKTRMRIILFGCISSGWTILIALFGSSVMNSLSFLGLLIGPLVASLLFAALPTFLNAAVVPMVISTYQQGAGMASGKGFSISTIGSIVGVISTGYILLPLFGIEGALLVGSGLYFCSLFLYGERRLGLVGLGIVLALGWFVSTKPLPENVLVDHSNGYHRIRIVERENHEGAAERVLYLDQWVHSVTEVGKVTPMIDALELITNSIKPPKTILVIGGGGFVMPRFLKQQFPDVEIDVVEIDPDIERFARKYLELGNEVAVHIKDGRQYIMSTTKTYDLIFNDAYRAFDMPPHITTLEFNQLVKNKLNENGIYLINIADELHEPNYPRTQASLLKTTQRIFPHLRAVNSDKYLGTDKYWGNTLVLATNTPLNLGRKIDYHESDGVLLTDNRAPTEFILFFDKLENKLSKWSGEG